MQLQAKNGLRKVFRVRESLPEEERELFVYRLLGAMSCYIDKETLDSCLESATLASQPGSDGL